MQKLNADEANKIVQEHLKSDKNRKFDGMGIKFNDNMWAFPNNRKIFIGTKDFSMDDKTFFWLNAQCLNIICRTV